MSGEISSFLSQVNTILVSISDGDLEVADKSVKSLASGLPDDKEAASLVHHLETLIARLCERTRQEQEQIRELFLTRDKFFSIISHDLRSPFNAILGFSDILSEEWDELTDSDKKTFLLNIKSTSHNTFDLLERLLQWSRVQTGKMKFTPGRLDICQLIRDTFHLLAEPAGLKMIRLISEVIPGTTAWADKDATLLVLRNLLGNAIKFTWKGGLVTVSALPVGQFLMITMADTGMGIAPENLKRLFRFEQQFRMEGTEREKGSGLGLVLCHEIIGKHGGRIWAESIEGEGSRFSFTIPFCPPDQDNRC